MCQDVGSAAVVTRTDRRADPIEQAGAAGIAGGALAQREHEATIARRIGRWQGKVQPSPRVHGKRVRRVVRSPVIMIEPPGRR